MFENLSRLLRTRRGEWESCCTRCGLCCYEKDLEPDGEIYINLDAPCPHLDTGTKICRVYERRFAVCRECRKVTWYHALFSRYMPRTCGYVQRFRKSGSRRFPILRKDQG